MTAWVSAMDTGFRNEVIDYFKTVQQRLISAFSTLDPNAELTEKTWVKESGAGGGEMKVLRGQRVEKAGANVSQVSGDAYPALEHTHAGKPYFATGVSTICHMMNPHAPIAHANLRLLLVGDTFWFGGGADLTPFVVYDEDKLEFHASLSKACEVLGPDAYFRYRDWCDEYFFIKHRNAVRGVGGIFFDYLNDRSAREIFAFVQAVGEAYVDVYPRILARRIEMPYSEKQKDEQLYWRGRYAEFNLVYDRGTKFGLMTGGNIEAIFVSMPPVVKW